MDNLNQGIAAFLYNLGIEKSNLNWGTRITILAGVLLLAYIITKIFHYLIIPAIHKITAKTKATWDDYLFNGPMLSAICRLIPPIIIYILLPFVFEDMPNILDISRKICLIYLIIVTLRLINAFLNSLYEISNENETLRNRPLKGIYQMIKLVAIGIGIILIISILMNQNAAAILAGLGASAAVLMLIFKDSILGLVAGVQLSANDMLRPGDWIKMPKLGIDGVVTEVNMTIVKVLNWDNTVTTIPPYTLVSDSFENWRVMQESGGRRVKRSLNIDMQSVRFCTAEERAAYEGEEWYAPLKDESKLVNLTAFRAYFTDWLRHQDRINQDLILMIRQLQPTGEGLPLEFYFFSADRSWVPYEMLQAEVFEYILAVLPRFGLRVFQFPTGLDVKSLTAGGESQPQ